MLSILRLSVSLFTGSLINPLSVHAYRQSQGQYVLQPQTSYNQPQYAAYNQYARTPTATTAGYTYPQTAYANGCVCGSNCGGACNPYAPYYQQHSCPGGKCSHVATAGYPAYQTASATGYPAYQQSTYASGNCACGRGCATGTCPQQYAYFGYQ